MHFRGNYGPQQVLIDKKDHPIHSPRKYKGSVINALYLPLINAMWLLVISVAIVIYILTNGGSSMSSNHMGSGKRGQWHFNISSGINSAKPVSIGKEFQVNFNFIPKDGLLSMDVELNDNVNLDNILFYNICCKHRGDLVCRLGSTRTMGVEGIMRKINSAEPGSSLNHKKKTKTMVKVVADHPNMTGAACWIIYRIK